MANLAPNELEIRSALKVVASRASFQKLLNVSNSDDGQIEMKECLSDLSTAFTPQPIEVINAVLCRGLNLPIESPEEENPRDQESAASG